MGNRLRENGSKYLIEMLIVAFGVFLGIYVSEWRTSTQAKNNAEKSLQFIIAELEENEVKLNTSIDYLNGIKDNLKPFSERITKEEGNRPYVQSDFFHITAIPGWTGLNIPKFKTLAFEGAKINGVFQELDIETTQHIASAYNYLEGQEEFGNTIINKFIETDSKTKTIDIIRSVELLTTDFLNSEKNLLRSLESTINKIRN